MKGYRTYVVAVLIGIATAAKALSWIDPVTYDGIMALLGPAGVWFLRSGVKNG